MESSSIYTIIFKLRKECKLLIEHSVTKYYKRFNKVQPEYSSFVTPYLIGDTHTQRNYRASFTWNALGYNNYYLQINGLLKMHRIHFQPSFHPRIYLSPAVMWRKIILNSKKLDRARCLTVIGFPFFAKNWKLFYFAINCEKIFCSRSGILNTVGLNANAFWLDPLMLSEFQIDFRGKRKWQQCCNE